MAVVIHSHQMCPMSDRCASSSDHAEGQVRSFPHIRNQKWKFSYPNKLCFLSCLSMHSGLIATTFQTLCYFVHLPSSTFGVFPQVSSAIFKRFCTLRDFQWVSDLLNSFPFVYLPSSTFRLFSRLSSMTKSGSATISKSMTNKKPKDTIYNICKLYEKLSMLQSRSANRTQLRLHSYLLLRFRDMNVIHHLYPPPCLFCGDIAPIFAKTTGLRKENWHISILSVPAPNTRKRFNHN
jgi:hypothetical protein